MICPPLLFSEFLIAINKYWERYVSYTCSKSSKRVAEYFPSIFTGCNSITKTTAQQLLLEIKTADFLPAIAQALCESPSLSRHEGQY